MKPSKTRPPSESSSGFTPYVPWRPRPRPTLDEPMPVANVVQEVLERLGGEGRVREFRVFEAFHDAIGAVFRARSAPEALRGGTLFVRVSSSAVAHELVLLRAEIVARINRELGQDLVSDLRTRVGPVQAPPRESTAGGKPEATGAAGWQHLGAPRPLGPR